jgi:hypothetical protein
LDEFVSKAAASEKEISELIEVGFEFPLQRDGQLTLGKESDNFRVNAHRERGGVVKTILEILNGSTVDPSRLTLHHVLN